MSAELFNFGIMLCPRRTSFTSKGAAAACMNRLSNLLSERAVRCAADGSEITLNDWVAIVPNMNGDGQPRFVLGKNVGNRETWRPDRETVEALLYGRRVKAESPREIPPPRRRAA